MKNLPGRHRSPDMQTKANNHSTETPALLEQWSLGIMQAGSVAGVWVAQCSASARAGPDGGGGTLSLECRAFKLPGLRSKPGV